MARKSLKGRVALDSNLFIYHFEDHPRFSPYTERVFGKIESGDLKAVTSIVSVLETLSYPLPPPLIEEIKEAFFSFPNLAIVNLDPEISFEAARIRREYILPLPDAIQLATARVSKAAVFVTNDKSLRRFKEVEVVLLNQT